MRVIESNVIGAIGEYHVLAELLRNGFDAYLAHGKTQADWDIIVIMDNKNIKIQVKTKTLNNLCTNNPIEIESGQCDYVIIVVINNISVKNETNIYDNYSNIILNISDYNRLKGNKKKLSIKCKKHGEYIIKECFKDYINNWGYIT